MKLLAPPKIVRGVKKHGAAKRCLLKTDQGEMFPVQVAEILGFKRGQCVMQRISRMGWDHPDVLAPKQEKKGYCVDGTPTMLARREGNEEWQSLRG